MIDEKCPICAKAFEPGQSTFRVPALPDRYRLGELKGRTHRRCLLRDSRRDRLRSALARSIAGTVHSPPSTYLELVDGAVLRVYTSEFGEHSIWNLADFVTFSIFDESVQLLLESSAGDEIPLASRTGRTIEFGPKGIPTLVGPSITVPMPSLSLSRLKQLFTKDGPIKAADSVVRIQDASGSYPEGPAIVAWGSSPIFAIEEPTPVLLRPLGEPGPARLLTYIDRWRGPRILEGGTPVTLRVNSKMSLSVVAVDSRLRAVSPVGTLEDRKIETDQPVRTAS